MNPGLARPARILLIEDNPGDVVLTTEAFEDAKVAVDIIVRSDGLSALEHLLAVSEGAAGAPEPDVILLDINLPGMSGLEILERIRGVPALTHLPVIVLSSTDAPETVLAAYRQHANSFITKPVKPDEFLEAVRAIETYWLTVVRLPHT